MKILSIEKTEQPTPWLKTFHAKYEHKGKVGNWFFVSRSKEILIDKPSKSIGVMVVPYHAEKEKLVVIKEFRIPLRGYEYSFPAGLLDGDEDPISAATRELKEETGLNVTRVLLQAPPSYSSAGLTDECLDIVFVHCNGEPDLSKNEASEDIEVLLLDEKEVETLLKRTDCLFSAKFWCLANNFLTGARALKLKNKVEELEKEVAKLSGVIAQNDLCHDLHGKVDAEDFAKGCAAEQRKIYGCAPDADRIKELENLLEKADDVISHASYCEMTGAKLNRGEIEKAWKPIIKWKQDKNKRFFENLDKLDKKG